MTDNMSRAHFGYSLVMSHVDARTVEVINGLREVEI